MSVGMTSIAARRLLDRSAFLPGDCSAAPRPSSMRALIRPLMVLSSKMTEAELFRVSFVSAYKLLGDKNCSSQHRRRLGLLPAALLIAWLSGLEVAACSEQNKPNVNGAEEHPSPNGSPPAVPPAGPLPRNVFGPSPHPPPVGSRPRVPRPLPDGSRTIVELRTVALLNNEKHEEKLQDLGRKAAERRRSRKMARAVAGTLLPPSPLTAISDGVEMTPGVQLEDWQRNRFLPPRAQQASAFHTGRDADSPGSPGLSLDDNGRRSMLRARRHSYPLADIFAYAQRPTRFFVTNSAEW